MNRNQLGASAALALLLLAADYTGAIAVENPTSTTTVTKGTKGAAAGSGITANPGAVVAKVEHKDLTVTKKTDKASPKLYEATSKGKHIPKVTIELTKTAPQQPRLNQNGGTSGKR